MVTLTISPHSLKCYFISSTVDAKSTFLTNTDLSKVCSSGVSFDGEALVSSFESEALVLIELSTDVEPSSFRVIRL